MRSGTAACAASGLALSHSCLISRSGKNSLAGVLLGAWFVDFNCRSCWRSVCEFANSNAKIPTNLGHFRASIRPGFLEAFQNLIYKHWCVCMCAKAHSSLFSISAVSEPTQMMIRFSPVWPGRTKTNEAAWLQAGNGQWLLDQYSREASNWNEHKEAKTLDQGKNTCLKSHSRQPEDELHAYKCTRSQVKSVVFFNDGWYKSTLLRSNSINAV